MSTLSNDFGRDVVVALSCLEAFGYQLTKSSPEHVRFENNAVVLDVRYDRSRSFDVDFEFSLKGDHPALETYRLRDVFREMDVPNADRESRFQSQNYDLVIDFLKRSAISLAEYATPILTGDLRSFEALERRQSSEAKTYTQGLQLSSVRKKAEIAWHEQRYAEFINLLQGFNEVLPESDRKKIDYARRKMLASETAGQ
jgi:hypothetical protein